MPYRLLLYPLYFVVLLGALPTDAFTETVLVRSGDNLQTALNAAQPGDTILLEAGATFRGNFTLPVKSGNQFITVRSSAPDSKLPGPGRRMTPAYAAQLPKIESPNTSPALHTVHGAHHWRLQFLHFLPTHLGYGDIIRIGDGSSAQNLLSQVPHHIELDRVLVHGHPLYGQKRGIALNGRDITIKNSYVADIKAAGAEAQAICGWNGPGPFTIENNYLEAAGENFMLGGSDPAIPNLVTSDVTVRYNHMSRPMAWKEPIIPTPGALTAKAAAGGALAAGTHTYRVIARRPVGSGTTGRSTASAETTATVAAGGAVGLSWSGVAGATEYRLHVRRPDGSQVYWTTTSPSFTDTGAGGTAGASPIGPGDRWVVKNIFELKNARRVLVEYNVFENNWLHGQPGYAILFTPRNQDGKCTWCVVEDVVFQYNMVRNSSAGVNLTGYDTLNTSLQTRNITIRHNLFYGLTSTLGGNGWFMLIGDQPRGIVVDHNTIDADGTAILYVHGGTAASPRQILGFQFTNNAVRHSAYGINGAHFAWGTGILDGYFPGATVNGNWMQGGTAARYPSGNHFSGTFASAFVDLASRDYRAAAGGILAGRATDGTNIGADVPTLLPALQRVLDGHAEGLTTSRPTTPSNLRVIVK
ncbi:MAG: hypothetical protein H0T05_01210 [Acidobacteria bacterium]|nr:hypothetical protein [Acidobacteriota bacterium]